MKKALLLLLGIVAVCFLIANVDYLAQFLDTLKTGALVPLVVSVVLMLARHLVQAASYDAAFEAVGHKTGFWHNVVLIFSLVFINTFCLFSGATGVAFIIDDAHRRGADTGQSTSGAILSQIGYFAAVLVISIIGFLTMLLSGSMNALFLVGGLLLAGTLLILSSMFVVGYRRPRILFRVFLGAEALLNHLLGLVKKHLSPGWGRKTANSFVGSATILARNPQGTLVTVSYASFSAVLNMACLVAIGYAFGCTDVAALVAAFAVAAISVILSPTPQGVGVVEAAIAAILTAQGTSLATATAIALVYRGIMFWIPFCIGAVLLSQSGFFADKRNPTEEQRAKDIAWISGTILLVIGLVNVGLALVPAPFEPFTVLTSWIDMGGLLLGPTLVVGGAFMVVLAVGLILRLRTAWALVMAVLVLVAGAEFLFVNTVQVAVALVLLALFLFWKRDAFDRPLVPREDRARLVREARENAERFRAWRASRTSARASRAASSEWSAGGQAAPDDGQEGDSADVPKPAAVRERLAAGGHAAAEAVRSLRERPSASDEVRRKTGWERQAVNGAEIEHHAREEGILSVIEFPSKEDEPS